MSFHYVDLDEWKSEVVIRPCTACDTNPHRCTGRCNGMSSITTVRRDPEEVALIKAKRQREHEDEILRQADAIRAHRISTGGEG